MVNPATLSQEDIERMVREAEINEDADQKILKYSRQKIEMWQYYTQLEKRLTTLWGKKFAIFPKKRADILNRSNLGMKVMHERNAHNFPLDLAANNDFPIAWSVNL